jgi:phage repressor protein C with HTH and peptisase S24 domain
MSNNNKMEKVTHELKQLRKLAALLQNAWYNGNWKAETYNEHEMEAIMKEQGLWPVTMSAETWDLNLKLNQYKGEMNVGENNMGEMNNNPGNTNGRNNNTVTDLIDEHLIIRETVGYEFLNRVAIEDIPEVLKFLKVVFNYTKMNNIK